MNTRFICENCGKEVPYNAEVCTFCGKLFSGVKCPVCKTSGRPERFRNGCPTCGYLSPKMDNLDYIQNEKRSNPPLKKKKKINSFYILLSLLLIMLISVFVIFIIKGNL